MNMGSKISGSMLNMRKTKKKKWQKTVKMTFDSVDKFNIFLAPRERDITITNKH